MWCDRIGQRSADERRRCERTNVYLTQGFFEGSAEQVSLVGGADGHSILPSVRCGERAQLLLHVTNGLLGTNGQAFSRIIGTQTGRSGTRTVVPTIVSVSPPNGSTNVGAGHIDGKWCSASREPADVEREHGSAIKGEGRRRVADANQFSKPKPEVVAGCAWAVAGTTR